MKMKAETLDNKTGKPAAVRVSRTAEKHQEHNEPDPFPPEGTDDKALMPGGDRPLSEKDRRKATEAALHHKP